MTRLLGKRLPERNSIPFQKSVWQGIASFECHLLTIESRWRDTEKTVLQNTKSKAVAHPVSVDFLRQLVGLSMGGCAISRGMAAWLSTCFEHPPTPLQNGILRLTKGAKNHDSYAIHQ